MEEEDEEEVGRMVSLDDGSACIGREDVRDERDELFFFSMTPPVTSFPPPGLPRTHIAVSIFVSLSSPSSSPRY